MSKKKPASRNAKLMAAAQALKPEKPIPYDPQLYEAIAAASDLQENELRRLREDIYRDVLPWFRAAHVAAIFGQNRAQLQRLNQRANREWRDKTGLPPINLANYKIIEAAVIAAGYPATEAGLRAWALGVHGRFLRREPEAKKKPPGPSKVAIALALLVEHPDWSNTKIAEQVPCHVKSLNRFPEFTKAKALLKAEREQMPRGQKVDGRIEAFDEQEDVG